MLVPDLTVVEHKIIFSQIYYLRFTGMKEICIFII